MAKVVKVTVENKTQRTEVQCDFFAGIMQSDTSSGRACEMLIGGTTDLDGLFATLRMLKKLEDKIFELIPMPRELAEIGLKLDEQLHKVTESETPIPPNVKVTLFPELVKLLNLPDDQADFLEEILKQFGPAGDES